MQTCIICAGVVVGAPQGLTKRVKLSFLYDPEDNIAGRDLLRVRDGRNLPVVVWRRVFHPHTPVPGKAPFLFNTTIPWAREMYPFIMPL